MKRNFTAATNEIKNTSAEVEDTDSETDVESSEVNLVDNEAQPNTSTNSSENVNKKQKVSGTSSEEIAKTLTNPKKISRKNGSDVRHDYAALATTLDFKNKVKIPVLTRSKKQERKPKFGILIDFSFTKDNPHHFAEALKKKIQKDKYFKTQFSVSEKTQNYYLTFKTETDEEQEASLFNFKRFLTEETEKTLGRSRLDQHLEALNQRFPIDQVSKQTTVGSENISIPFISPIASLPIPSSPIVPITVPDSPIASVPMSSSPIVSITVPDSPIASVPMSSSPIASIPVPGSPIASVPMSSSPIASTPLHDSPIAPMQRQSSTMPSSPATGSSSTTSKVNNNNSFFASKDENTTAPINRTELYSMITQFQQRTVHVRTANNNSIERLKIISAKAHPTQENYYVVTVQYRLKTLTLNLLKPECVSNNNSFFVDHNTSTQLADKSLQSVRHKEFGIVGVQNHELSVNKEKYSKFFGEIMQVCRQKPSP